MSCSDWRLDLRFDKGRVIGRYCRVRFQASQLVLASMRARLRSVWGVEIVAEAGVKGAVSRPPPKLHPPRRIARAGDLPAFSG